ncbi:monooxygenase domain protein [Nitzschia inconspicua]|uniref:Monooxygenase domain protein n=1 Tax=Nitzschia inconspicua TaxID=303405 RepID=A0A9K3K652_9STRA|nr:monooxygenase domain protein [Nitzschia inconspicua]KAG7339525.1 monooxygenase domain protein [Nitzschia inconspicua]KAG7359424.1 monooxygenase domain protein [Nitzschia inconspicua]
MILSTAVRTAAKRCVPISSQVSGRRRWSSSAALVSTTKLRQQLEDGPLMMGCVCYDPAVYDIWGGIKDYLVEEAKVPFDYVLYTNYEQQVASLVQRHIDVAWNGPLAHVMVEQAIDYNNKDNQAVKKTVVSLGMRDVDRDFESIVIVRKDANISSVDDLNGQTVLTGACDSPQAHVVPLHYLQNVRNVQFADVLPQNLDLGKHGDTAAGEVKAMELMMGRDGAKVAIVSKMMWDRACQGMLPSIQAADLLNRCEVLDAVQLPVFDHCQFDAVLHDNDPPERKEKLQDFSDALFAMNMDNPKHQPLMKLEGIQKQWEGPRQQGYNIVRNAMIPGSSLANHRPANDLFRQQTRAYTVNSSTGGSKIRVAVVGAGVAGLQTVRALQARPDKVEVTAFEGASNVGGLWKQNYSNFGVQVPKQLYEFQDYPMTEVRWGEFPTGPQVQTHIENYADAYGLRKSIQLNTKVTGVTKQQDGADGNWKVETQSTVDGSTTEQSFDYVVVSTGLYSSLKKTLPNILANEGSDTVVHSSDFVDASVAKGKKVVVVGSGKSAVDCAVESSRAGASSVTLLQRTAHWPTPRKIAGVIPFQYIFMSRLGQALLSTHTAPIPGSGPAINAFHQSVIGPLLMKPVFRAVEELFAFQYGLYGDIRPKADVVKDFYDVALLLNSDLTDLRKVGKVTVQMGEMESFDSTSNQLTLKDGNTLDADLIVCATGFAQDYSILDADTTTGLDLQDDGMYLYRYILPEKVSNLAFIGHMAATTNISSYGIQAEWLARYLCNELVEVPTEDCVSKDIEARKEWARSWMPAVPNRGMNILLHQTHYHDQLLRDMGENPHRKSNPLSEYLMPYEPADYNGIMGGRPIITGTA